MAREDDLESKNSLQGELLHMALGKARHGDSQPSLFTLQIDRSTVAYVHPKEEDYRSPTMLEQGWKCRKKKRDGGLLQLAIGGQFVRKGIKDVLKENKTISKR
ncbi:hypothetical protein H5410_006354 [Solanum commersonii]|uniref:Uncharacterized protein n=1 Tax=Solanum commersonii TaxID=4109 RepID=A0A9J6A9M2_SOLCO|nr:hypothetical protein H5410_006354 [Solanum commersonii]